MSNLNVPFNIGLLNLDKNPAWTQSVKPVTSQDVFEGATRNFHPDGLFSTVIFGTPGTPGRFMKESWIDIKIQVLHPAIYKTLVSLKGLYEDIIFGRAYAQWDGLLCDFVESDAEKGSTGYTFFLNYFRLIKHVPSESLQRQEKIKLVTTRQEQALISKIYVLPAGYRDVEIDDTGRVSSDEINELYNSLMSVANTIPALVVRNDLSNCDRQRVSLQNTFNELYQKAIDIIRGKNNLMMSKWAGRAVFDSTRNVLTAMNTTMVDLDDPYAPQLNDTMVGVLQFMKTARLKTLHYLKTGFLSEVFTSASAPAVLTDMRSMKSVHVSVKSRTYDKWMSSEGLEKVINSYRESSIRSNPITVEGKYLGLVYRGIEGTYRFIHGIEELPQADMAQYCTPITYNDLFYVACYRWAAKVPVIITRYPIATGRSTYPSMTYLMSTMRSDRRMALDAQFIPIEGDIAPRFPITGEPTYDSQSPHAARLENLGADHDGDTGSLISLQTDEAVQEIEQVMHDKSFYLGPEGKMVSNTNTATINYVVTNLTME